VSHPRYGGAPLTEPEALALAGLIDRRPPDRIVSLHEPLACVDYDGPGEALAGRMAGACGLPLRRLGGKPGSLGSYAGETLGIPIITLELPPLARTLDADRLWDRYGAALLEAVVERGGGGLAD
jgi:protein MpaA